MGIIRGEQGPETDLAVDRAGEKLPQGPVLGEGLGFYLHLPLEGGQDGLGVGPVQDMELAGVADLGGQPPEPQVGQGVEGPPGDPLAGDLGELPGPVEHLLGRLAGEGQKKNPFRGHAGLHQPGQAVDQGPGLARSGPGHHQNRPLQALDRLQLGGIQFSVVVDHR